MTRSSARTTAKDQGKLKAKDRGSTPSAAAQSHSTAEQPGTAADPPASVSNLSAVSTAVSVGAVTFGGNDTRHSGGLKNATEDSRVVLESRPIRRNLAKPACWNCGAPDPKCCSRCKLGWFCSGECQRAQFPGHKSICREDARNNLLRGGLVNMGYNCYAAASLQMLIALAPLRDYFLSGAYRSELKTNGCQSSLAVTQAVGDFFREKIAHQERSIVALLKVIWRVSDLFPPATQHDAHEFLNWLLEQLNEGTNTVKQKLPRAIPNEPKAGESLAACATRYEKTMRTLFENSFVHRLTGGLYHTHVSCRCCPFEGDRFEPFGTLEVTLPPQNLVTRRVWFFPLPAGSRPVIVTMPVPEICNATDFYKHLASRLMVSPARLVASVPRRDLRGVRRGGSLRDGFRFFADGASQFAKKLQETPSEELQTHSAEWLTEIMDDTEEIDLRTTSLVMLHELNLPRVYHETEVLIGGDWVLSPMELDTDSLEWRPPSASWKTVKSRIVPQVAQIMVLEFRCCWNRPINIEWWEQAIQRANEYWVENLELAYWDGLPLPKFDSEALRTLPVVAAFPRWATKEQMGAYFTKLLEPKPPGVGEMGRELPLIDPVTEVMDRHPIEVPELGGDSRAASRFRQLKRLLTELGWHSESTPGEKKIEPSHLEEQTEVCLRAWRQEKLRRRGRRVVAEKLARTLSAGAVSQPSVEAEGEGEQRAFVSRKTTDVAAEAMGGSRRRHSGSFITVEAAASPSFRSAIDEDEIFEVVVCNIEATDQCAMCNDECEGCLCLRVPAHSDGSNFTSAMGPIATSTADCPNSGASVIPWRADMQMMVEELTGYFYRGMGQSWNLEQNLLEGLDLSQWHHQGILSPPSPHFPQGLMDPRVRTVLQWAADQCGGLYPIYLRVDVPADISRGDFCNVAVDGDDPLHTARERADTDDAETEDAEIPDLDLVKFHLSRLPYCYDDRELARIAQNSRKLQPGFSDTSLISQLYWSHQPELLVGEWRCEKCNMQEAERTQNVWRFGDAVFVHLSRFKFDFTWTKNARPVSFPDALDLGLFTESTDSGPALYDLFAIVTHRGNIMAGHYKAYSKAPSRGSSGSSGAYQWMEFDDEIVLTRNRYPKGAASDVYILLYVRR